MKNTNLSQFEKQLPSFRGLVTSLNKLIENRLWMKVLIGLALGVVMGILLGPDLNLFPRDVSTVLVNWLAFPGKLFIALVQMIVVPLVFASIIRGLTSTSDMSTLKLMGVRGGAIFSRNYFNRLLYRALSGNLNQSWAIYRSGCRSIYVSDRIRSSS